MFRDRFVRACLSFGVWVQGLGFKARDFMCFGFGLSLCLGFGWAPRFESLRFRGLGFGVGV